VIRNGRGGVLRSSGDAERTDRPRRHRNVAGERRPRQPPWNCVERRAVRRAVDHGPDRAAGGKLTALYEQLDTLAMEQVAT
jgi:hypothetical protein